ncbi:Ig-like domain-containing protein, partial [Thorsellia kenyensis]
LTNDKTPTLLGTALPGAKVDIYFGEYKLNTRDVLADENGKWRFDIPSTFIDDGVQTYTVKTVDASGNALTKTFDVKYDLTPPDAGVIVSVEDSTDPNKGFIPNGGGTNESSPTLRGTGEPGTTVQVYDKATGTKLLASAVVSNQGTWILKLQELDDGVHEFYVTLTDQAGNTSIEGERFVVVINTSIPDILSPDSFELLDNVGEFQGPIKSNSITDDNKPQLVGRAPDGVVEVEVYVNGVAIGRATVMNNEWSFDIENPLSDGQNRISVAPVNSVGTTGPQTDIVFNVSVGQPQTLDEGFLEL